MSTLKKGDLVMTEHGRVLQIDIEPWEGESHIYCIDLSDISQVAVKPNTVFKPTRKQVEAYLKEKGWEFEFIGFGEVSLKTWNNKTNQYSVMGSNNGDWSIFLGEMTSKHFTPAPAMQAEAILMAKLLNATKD